MADTCISGGIRRVSGMYQVRISHGFGAWLIRVSAAVSGEYQACIRYVSVVAWGAWLIRVSDVYQRPRGVCQRVYQRVSALYQEDRGGRR